MPSIKERTTFGVVWFGQDVVVDPRLRAFLTCWKKRKSMIQSCSRSCLGVKQPVGESRWRYMNKLWVQWNHYFLFSDLQEFCLSVCSCCPTSLFDHMTRWCFISWSLACRRAPSSCALRGPVHPQSRRRGARTGRELRRRLFELSDSDGVLPSSGGLSEAACGDSIAAEERRLFRLQHFLSHSSRRESRDGEDISRRVQAFQLIAFLNLLWSTRVERTWQ